MRENNTNSDKVGGIINYRDMIVKVYGKPRLTLALRCISHASVLIVAALFAVRLLLLFLGGDHLSAIKIAAVAAVPFLTVSVARKIINAKRPYELIGDFPHRPKSKSGESFPSRHTFSAFLIATLLLPWIPLVGIALYLVGVLLAASRVLLGIHFLRDVIAGALLGAACGAIGIIIINFI